MGEIADALRRARGPRATSVPVAERAPEPLPPREPVRREPPRRGAAAGPALEKLTPDGDAALAVHDSDVEVCRRLASRVRTALDARSAKSLAIVSSVRGEGKTTVLCDLGLALASLSQAHDVALVDLDLRVPSLARTLGVHAEAGVEDVLHGRASLDRIRVRVDRPSLDLYPALEPQREAHELLVSPSFADMLHQLESRYETVLIDTAPTLLFPDVNLILKHAHACIPIARARETRARLFGQMIDLLPQGKMIGHVLNCGRAPKLSYDHYGYREASEEAPPLSSPEAEAG